MNESFYYYDDHIKIGETIKKLRLQANLSQTKLSEGICDRTTIIHLEKGRSKQTSISLLNQLCRRLSITLDDFFLIAYNGNINQFWFKKSEIDSLIKIRDYEKAYQVAKRFYSEDVHPVDKQFFGLIEGHYYYHLKEYTKAKEIYLNALKITSSNIEDEVYTLTEMRLIDGIVYCNWLIDGKLSNEETLKYIKVLNHSIYNYPINKDYRLIISLILNTSHFYFTLKLYDDTITIINNAIELSHKYCCYDYMGNLWLILASIYDILGDKDKAKEFYDRSNKFFYLFSEKNLHDISSSLLIEVIKNINC